MLEKFDQIDMPVDPVFRRRLSYVLVVSDERRPARFQIEMQ